MTSEWPDLGMLELLVAVSEHSSISAAARSVEMAQPNASRALKQLERTFGVQLVDRHPGGSQLTADGAVVVDWAREVLESAHRMRAGTDALRTQQHSQLTVAASMTVAECLMPVWLAELRRRYPDLAIKLRVHNSEEVFDTVRDGACDLGFVESPGVRADLRYTAVARDRLVVVVAPEHPWARRRRPLSGADLVRTPLVVREAGSGTRTTLEKALQPYGSVVPTLELNSNAAVQISVSAGAGPAVLSELTVASLLRTGELIAIPTENLNLERTIRAVWRRAGSMRTAAADLVRIARRLCD